MIRAGSKEDLPEIAGLWENMVLEAKKGSPDKEQWVYANGNLFDANIYHVFVYEQDNHIVGFVDGLAYYEPSTGKMHGLAQHYYVKPEYRGQGISKKLMKSILEFANKVGLEIYELFCFPEMQVYWEERGFKKERILMKGFP